MFLGLLCNMTRRCAMCVQEKFQQLFQTFALVCCLKEWVRGIWLLELLYGKLVLFVRGYLKLKVTIRQSFESAGMQVWKYAEWLGLATKKDH